MRAREQGLERDRCEHRRREGEQQPVGLRRVAGPAQDAPDDDEKRAKQDGAEHAELGQQELGRLTGMEGNAAPIRVLGRVGERREAVCLIPEEVRSDQEQGARQGDPEMRGGEAGARGGRDGEKDRCTRDEVGHGILRVEADAERDGEQERVSHVRPLDQTGESEERERPGREQGNIGRDDAARQRHGRQQRVGQPRPERDACRIEAVREQVDEARRQQVDERGGQAHARFAVAAERCCAANDPGDEGWLREVTRPELPRPGPVLRLVHVEVDAVQGQGGEAGHRHEREHGQKGASAVLAATVLVAKGVSGERSAIAVADDLHGRALLLHRAFPGRTGALPGARRPRAFANSPVRRRCNREMTAA